MDFFTVSVRSIKKGYSEIAPVFHIGLSDDLMVRGGSFYAIWDEERGLWSENEFDVARFVDRELWEEYDRIKENNMDQIYVRSMKDFSSHSWENYKRYIAKCPDNYHSLDSSLTFADTVTTKKDYASKRLSYVLSDGDCDNWHRLISTLYDPIERRKIEWAIGAIISGDAKVIQKFLVFYGDAGTGKSTILNIIQEIFNGYYCIFDARALATTASQFSMEAFKTNPLVAIQHDGDLSRIEDNSRLNSIIAHEEMTINEKHKSLYVMRMNSFLLMATNKPVKITDAKSGLIRRLIDVNPSGRLLPADVYQDVMSQIHFEIGAIAKHCLDVYKKYGKHFYDGYRSEEMQYKTDVFFNFMDENYFIFSTQDGVSLKQAYSMYKEYCMETSLSYLMPMYAFREEFKNYFREFKPRAKIDGVYYRSYYSGFITDKFRMYNGIDDFSKSKDDNNTENEKEEQIENKEKNGQSIAKNDEDESFDILNRRIENIVLNSTHSIFDIECKDCKAQYANDDGRPLQKWINVKTTLKDLDTTKVHYVQIPENHIVIDFDIKDPVTGEKSAELNLKAASEFPKTYTEFSKSGAGVHLHYIYDGDSSKLSRLYSNGIEIKVFSGNSSLRRKLSLCNDIPIAHISGGLPLKEKKVISTKYIKSEKSLRDLIKKNLRKEIHPATKPSVDFIYKILDDAYNSGLSYDVSDMSGAILSFAANSTNQAGYCIKVVGQMRFKSKDFIDIGESDVDRSNMPSMNRHRLSNSRFDEDSPIVFFDIEVFPNLLLINYKADGEGKPMCRLVNPTPKEIEPLFDMKLVGYNNRRYDNHIVYARYLGKTNEEIYKMSKAIISGTKEEQRAAMYGEAYNMSYTDIYDFASAGNKMSLKKAEIEMGIHHLELGMDWDKPVPEEEWDKVSEYCDNDVLATEARFHWLKGDWTARQILADLAGLTVNDTTNTLSTRFIFGNNKNPQHEFNYRDLSKPVRVEDLDPETFKFLKQARPEMFKNLHPVRTDFSREELDNLEASILPYFPGYKFEWVKKTVAGKKINSPLSTYRGEEIGEGGYVYSEPGIYTDVALIDITSMHPTSTINECLFGPRFTKAFKDIVDSRVAIKHEDWDTVSKLLDGRLIPYIEKVKSGELTSSDLSAAMKTVINSVYGLTSAKFMNPFKDKRNVDNIVAKRGALFMVDLKHFVQDQGYTVVHIKTDSIKIANATPSIIESVMEFGREYGYNFEHEATYERMCIVNKAVYIAKYKDGEHIFKLPTGEKVSTCWTATGAEFQHPYIFKELFSKHPIVFEDMCETKNVKSALYLDMNEGYPLHAYTKEEYDSEMERIINDAVEKNKQKIANSKDPELKQQEVIDAALKRYKGPNIGDLVETHNYVFIGRAGQFCPIKKDCGGGILVREQNGKYVSATDADGYRWLESEMVRNLNMSDAIDISYYRKKIDDVVADISVFGDFDRFVSDDPYESIEIP